MKFLKEIKILFVINHRNYLKNKNKKPPKIFSQYYYCLKISTFSRFSLFFSPNLSFFSFYLSSLSFLFLSHHRRASFAENLSDSLYFHTQSKIKKVNRSSQSPPQPSQTKNLSLSLRSQKKINSNFPFFPPKP